MSSVAKRWIPMILALVLMIPMLTACASTRTETSVASTTSADVTASETSNPPEENTGEKIVLNMRCEFASESDVNRRNWLEKTVQNFNASSDKYEVVVDYVDVETHRNKLKVEMAGGNPPDIFRTWGLDYSKVYAENGMLLDITEYINTDPQWKEQLLPVAFEMFTYGDKVYGLGVDGFVEGIYYNKEVLAQLGKETPKTYEEFIDVMKAAKSAGIVPIAVGAKDKWSNDFYITGFFDRFGGTKLFNEINTGNGSWVNPDYVQAVNTLIEIGKLDAYQKGVSSMKYNEARSLVGNGKALMFFGGTWDIASFYSEEFPEGTGDKIGFMNFPTFEKGNGDQGSIIAGFSPGYAISGKIAEDKKAGAVEFLKQLTNSESLADFTYSCNIISSGKFEIDSTKVNKLFAEQLKVLAESTSQYTPYNDLMHPGIAEVWHDVGAEIVTSANSIKAEDVLAKMDKAYQEFKQ